MTRLQRGGPVLAGAAGLALALAGCGHFVMGESTNRGSGSTPEDTTVEDAFIVPAYVPGHCAIQTDAGAAMRFTVTNNRSADTERLLGLSTGAAQQAQIVSGADIPPKSRVGFGEPSTQQMAADTQAPAVRLDALDPGLRPAMTSDVTFHFKQAGDITLEVPVEACPRQVQ
ncbi:hypothetical protein DVS77_14770 [Mycolicibacterium moriokaense]|nr:hypothetical protein DVS77_14770 [Mycolicibacterium moriokaense]